MSAARNQVKPIGTCFLQKEYILVLQHVMKFFETKEPIFQAISKKSFFEMACRITLLLPKDFCVAEKENFLSN